MSDYSDFLARRTHSTGTGFDPIYMPDFLFDFQKSLCEWAIRRGRAALFVDCGGGKTPMQLVWAENIVRHTNKSVLIVTPLAVSYQTLKEAEQFGIPASRSQDGAIPSAAGILITNYERLHHFNSDDFAGMVCDESSCLKNHDSVRRGEITEFMRKMPYRLLATATASPNDHSELGTSSEALGELGNMDMLNRYFKNDNNTSDTKGRWRGFSAPHERVGPGWRFKHHAETPFWKWVASWARAMRRPSDLGFEDGNFILPPLEEREHVVKARTLPDGFLFDLPASNMREEREERRRTITERCERVAELVNHDRPALVWCHLNPEGDLLAKLIPDAIQVSGRDSDDEKEEKLLSFARGESRVMVTKPKIGAWGLNLQHCSHITFFPSHSYEQYYQGVRRCWRFGQKSPVIVDIVTTEGELRAKENLQRKAKQADRMFSALVEHMNEAMQQRPIDLYKNPVEVPAWLSASK